MPDDRARLHAVGTHCGGQRDLHGEQIIGCTRSMPVTVSGADIASVTENPDSCAISGSTSRDARGEHRFGRQQFGAHRRPLRTLAGEHPHRSAVVLAHRGRIRASLVGDLAQTVGQFREVRRRSRRCAPAGARAGAPACRPDPQAPGSSARCSTQSASRRDVRRSSSAEVADSGNSSGPAAAARRLVRMSAVSGACSSTAWTLVPDIPNDDTAVRRGWSPSIGHGVISFGTNRPGLDLCELLGQAVKCTIAGTTPCRSARIALISPTAPAADSVWPTLLFAEPSAHGSGRRRIPAPGR